ncbi:hypothetical protein TRFO_21681 [Tritrichomonas foetus]|uniref:Myb-like DNA-binding domain containing protein n=1 Tax=Tritrichomonas foetus TaxID=1144522 RepID=A0A1J4KEL9_9EUKA|nr:hypothetical protein TRFO_21681 [Tritrichomonas foetus]|eukprot:OHT09376.1 hypothetical protein TRFO_21681 [Tritrichomonas foetus]
MKRNLYKKSSFCKSGKMTKEVKINMEFEEHQYESAVMSPIPPYSTVVESNENCRIQCLSPMTEVMNKDISSSLHNENTINFNTNVDNHEVHHDGNYNKKKWNDEEDNLLKKAVQKYGIKSWSSVATMVPNKNPKQCRERWTAQINPALTKTNWTNEEDHRLIHLHLIHGNLWTRIAMFLPGRSGNSVKNRYNWLERRRLTSFPFVGSSKITGSLPVRRTNLPIPIIQSVSTQSKQVESHTLFDDYDDWLSCDERTSFDLWNDISIEDIYIE